MKPYNGYLGSLRYDPVSGLYHGVLLDIEDVVTFEAKTAPEAENEFHKSVDVYLDFCARLNQPPCKP